MGSSDNASIQVSYVEVSYISSTSTDEERTIRRQQPNRLRKVFLSMRKRMTALKYGAKHNISVTAETRCYIKYTTVILDGVKHTAM